MEKRGSGSKENVGRKKTPYITKTLSKRGIPIEIYDICLSLVDAEVLKFKNMKKLVVLLLFATVISCTPHPEPFVPECTKVMGRGFDGEKCFLILKGNKLVYPPCDVYKIGDTYCE